MSTEEKELRELYVSSSSQAYETVAANSTILFLSEQIYTATDSDIYPQGPPPCVEFVEERASKQEGPPPYYLPLRPFNIFFHLDTFDFN